MQKRVNFVVTDLDDTIWDWLSMWYNSFNPYLNRISTELNIDIDQLKKDFKQLHEKYATTESSFIIDDLTSLNESDRTVIYNENGDAKSIMHEYYSNKKRNLFLFEDTLKVLSQIKNSGAMIVGFTESHSFYTKYRLKTLNIDGLIDCIYAPVDTEVPESVKKHYPEGYWEPKITEFRYLSRKVKKPNAEILEIILKDFNAKKETSIYIGDKLARDVFMANEAGITSVYAKYGDKSDSSNYELLKDVTHWSEEEVQQEQKFREDFREKTIVPDLILERSLQELTNSFVFYSFDCIDKQENNKNAIEVWKKVVDVQQHFNDIELRIRNYALTLFTAIVAAMGLLEKEKIILNLSGANIPASSLLGFAGILTLIAFWYMDRYWYHKLLLGAVKQGQFIEDMHYRKMPELGLTKSIGLSSPQKLSLFKRNILTIHSSNKYWIFYGLLFAPLIVLTTCLYYGHSLPNKNNSRAKTIVSKEKTKSSSPMLPQKVDNK